MKFNSVPFDGPNPEMRCTKAFFLHHSGPILSGVNRAIEIAQPTLILLFLYLGIGAFYSVHSWEQNHTNESLT